VKKFFMDFNKTGLAFTEGCLGTARAGQKRGSQENAFCPFAWGIAVLWGEPQSPIIYDGVSCLSQKLGTAFKTAGFSHLANFLCQILLCQNNVHKFLFCFFAFSTDNRTCKGIVAAGKLRKGRSNANKQKSRAKGRKGLAEAKKGSAA
jgi:hypothetical protein